MFALIIKQKEMNQRKIIFFFFNMEREQIELTSARAGRKKIVAIYLFLERSRPQNIGQAMARGQYT